MSSMSTGASQIPFSRLRQVPVSTYPHLAIGSVNSTQQQPLEESIDLVTYLVGLLPENINPLHVLVGVGIAFSGVAGAFVALHLFRKGRSSQEVNDLSHIKNVVNGLNGNYEPTFLKLKDGVIPKGVLILNECPRGRKTPCIAPYALKLETFLRVAGIKYEMDPNSYDSNNNFISTEKTDSMLILDMDKHNDTQVDIKELSDQFGLDLSSHLSFLEKAVEKAFIALLEQKIYWGLCLYRWVYDGARSIEKIQYLPEMTRDSLASVSRTIECAAWHHGLGKRTPTQVVLDVNEDLHALSSQLGNKKFLFSDVKPSEVDCTAFAMLSQFLWTMEGPFHNTVADTYMNLSDYCWRMRREFWADWESCLHKSD